MGGNEAEQKTKLGHAIGKVFVSGRLRWGARQYDFVVIANLRQIRIQVEFVESESASVRILFDKVDDFR